MPGHSMGTSLIPSPRPAFSGLQYRNAEATRGVWGMLPQKILESLSFLGRFWGYFRPYRRLELEHFDNSLVPRPHPDFIYQPWRKIGRRPGSKTTSRTGNGGLG